STCASPVPVARRSAWERASRTGPSGLRCSDAGQPSREYGYPQMVWPKTYKAMHQQLQNQKPLKKKKKKNEDVGRVSSVLTAVTATSRCAPHYRSHGDGSALTTTTPQAVPLRPDGAR